MFYYVDRAPDRSLFIACRTWEGTHEDIVDYYNRNVCLTKARAQGRRLRLMRRDAIEFQKSEAAYEKQQIIKSRKRLVAIMTGSYKDQKL